jgi:hypothetical protein
MPEPAAPVVAERASQAEALAAAACVSRSEPESNLKSASVTLRMSAAECKQLRRRAAEAGMTVSAYLRSCTFEAETLRAQVKEALAELRAASTLKAKPPATDGPRNRLGALHRLLPRLHPAA